MPVPTESRRIVPLQDVIAVAEFRAALRAFLHRTEELTRACGLTPQRYLLLLTIKGAADGSERLTFGELAERMKIERNTATELVQRAEQAGLVEREPSTSDGRVVYLQLTGEGERRLDRALRANSGARAEFAHELEQVLAAFKRTAL